MVIEFFIYKFQFRAKTADSNILTADRTRLIPNFGFTSLLLIDGDLVLAALVELLFVSFTKRALDRWLLFLAK